MIKKTGSSWFENGKEVFNDDLNPLARLLTQKKIPYILRRHPATAETLVKTQLGYWPTGEWQIIIDKTWSVIRGMVSFGYYEIMALKVGVKYQDPCRYLIPEELVDDLKKNKK